MTVEKQTAQKTALISIEIRMCFLGLPKLVSRMVPPIGVKIRGVRKATPGIPYFFQTLMKRRFLGVNFRFFVKILSRNLSFNILPRKVKRNTLAIIPETVMRIVPPNDKPAA